MNNNLEKIARLLRFYILTMTTRAGSGHATSSLSAVEIMTNLFFKHFRFDLNHPENSNNDRLIFSKGHSSPLFYALYKVAGAISEDELYKYRTFDSNLEGHPTMRFPFTEAPTGSLGQGLSVGVGMALGLMSLHKIACLPARQASSLPMVIGTPRNDNKKTSPSSLVSGPFVYVLLGDGEMAEGQIWEAIQIASHYKLNNLIAVLDVNRLGQSQETMLAHNIQDYANRVNSFGWRVYLVQDGHDLGLIDKAYSLAIEQSAKSDKPAMIIFKTVKGKGVSFLEDKENWHGKVLNQEELKTALKELGEVDRQLIVRSGNFFDQDSFSVIPAIRQPAEGILINKDPHLREDDNYSCKAGSGSARQLDSLVSTRQAFGEALVKLGEVEPKIVVLDGDVQNSTGTELFAKKFPGRFYQMFIAEQNMVSSACGMAKMALKPVVSTFSAFLSRAFDQLRIIALSNQNIIFNGSHAGVSVGQDGPSQMGLEDLSLFRSLPNSTVLYPADAVAAQKLLFQAINLTGIVYFRTQRPKTPVIYDNNEEFKVRGSKTFYSSNPAKRDEKSTNNSSLPNPPAGGSGSNNIMIVAAGITVLESLKAQTELAKENIPVTVIDCYSIKPIDKETLIKIASLSSAIITVEDHYPVGGLGDAVLEALSEVKHPKIIKLGIYKTPRSGTPEELLKYEEIDKNSIIRKVKEICQTY